MGTLLLGTLPLSSVATNDPPSSGGNVTGDWTVTDARSYSGVTINVAGNLVIASGGSLTLSGVALNINGSSAGAFRIEVMAGGTLSTDGATKIATGSGYNYRFQMDYGSAATLVNTSISNVGVMGNQYGRGVYIGSDSVLLDGCTVKDGYEGIHVELSSPTILNSTLSGHQYSALYIEKGEPLVDNCTFLDNGHYGGAAAVYTEYANSTARACRISNCTMDGNEHGAFLNLDSPVLFENNTVANSTARGLWVRQSDAAVRNNNITGNKEYGIYIDMASPVIEDNDVTKNGQAAAPAAGISIYLYSNPLIKNNTIASNTEIGVHIHSWCAPVLLGNSITANTNAGVKMSYCGNARLEGNNISMNYDGVNMQGSTPAILGNALWANLNDGMHADGGDTLFEGNAVTGAGAAGIHAINGARLLVGNSTFLNSQWGISAETGSTVLLVNGNFTGQFREAFKCDAVSTLDWVVDARSYIDGNDALLMGNLTIGSGGRLALSNMRLEVGSSSSYRRYIDLRSGGELALETAALTAHDPAYNYQFTSAGTLEALNSTMAEMGWAPGVDGETAGLYASAGTVRLYNTNINNNYIGLVLRGAIVLMEQSSISGSEVGAVDARSSVIEARNSTIQEGSQYSLRLDLSSRAEMKVVQFNRTMVAFLDGPSVLNVYWYLRVHVEWASHDPIAFATVNLSDQQGQRILTRVTDDTGRTAWEEVQEFSQRAAAKTSFTPHTVNVTSGGFSSEKQVTVDRSLEFTFTFTDDTPPELAITSPADPSFLPTQTVELRGTASDPESGIKKVEVSWNNATWYNASTTDGWANWNYTFQLAPTTLTLRARATDWAGLMRTAGVTVTIEVSAPLLIIDAPREGLLTNQTPIPLAGITIREAVVTASVNGAAYNATNADGTISGLLPLSEGANLIEVKATDRAGNFNISARNVTLDTIPPWIRLELPAVSYTNQQSVTINGSTDGAVLTVNGMVANLTDGNFSKAVVLDYGAGTTNTSIEVVARDPAGNTNRTTIHILRDITPPTITVTSPAKDVAITNQTSIAVSGVTEPDNTLTVDGVPVPLDAGGNFSIVLVLQEGINIIEIKALDPAGNSRKVLRTVHSDSVPPALTVGSPVDGTRTYSTEVDVAGTTEPGVRLTVNGEEVNVGLDGNFSRVHLALGIGPNNITVTAVDPAGNVRTVTVKIIRDESPPPGPQPKPAGPPKSELETMLPWMLIILIILGGVGAAAWVGIASRRKPKPRQKARTGASSGRAVPSVGSETARSGGPGPGGLPRTAQEMYAADYAAKFSRPAAPSASPWDQQPAAPDSAPAPHEVSWGDEPEVLQMSTGPAVQVYQAPGPGPSYQADSRQPPASPSGTEHGTEHDTEAHTKAVDSDIDDLLKKIGEASKKK